MAKHRRLWQYKRVWLIGLFGLFLLVGGYFRLGHFYVSDTDWADRLQTGDGQVVEVGHFLGPVASLRYVRIGRDSSRPLLAFVHGAPGSGLFWNPLLRDEQLRQQADLLVYDRPGYGGSDYGRAMTSVYQQAVHLRKLLQHHKSEHQRLIVIGSSYGGTVAARTAMLAPYLMDGLLLQSASLKPGAERTLTLTHPTSSWLFRWLIPGGWDVANQEKLSHEIELTDMLASWDSIACSTVIVQGSADWLIYPDNSYFACHRLHDRVPLVHHMVAEGSHDLIWTQPELLRDYLLELLADTVKNQ